MIISCNECGGKVSDKARVCPHCGAPQRKSARQKAIEGVNRVRQHVFVEDIALITHYAADGFASVFIGFGKVLLLCAFALVLLFPHGVLIAMFAPSAYSQPHPIQIFLSRGVFLIFPLTVCRPILACAKRLFESQSVCVFGNVLVAIMWLFAVGVPIANLEVGFEDAIVADAIGLIVSILAIGSLRRYVKRLAVVRGEKNDEGQMSNNVEEKVVAHTDVKNEEPTGAAQGDEEAIKELERIKEYAARRGERE